MKLLIRADANAAIASGHIRRCLSIADAFEQKETEIVFVSSEVEAKQVLAGTKYRCIILENDYREKESELPLLREIMQREAVDGILVDSYEVTGDYLSRLAKECPLAYIADTEQNDFHGDMLINYTQCVKRQHPETKFLLLGERYVPLRREFRNVPHRRREKVERVLITTGGSDPDGMSGDILRGCMGSKLLRDVHYTVVVGNYFEHVDKLEKLAEKCSQVELKYNVTDMAQLMKTHDAAVSAGGTTLFELCACGLPTVSFAMADNQLPMTRYLEECGAIAYAGDERDNKESVVQKVVRQLEDWMFHIEEMNERAARMSRMVDGLGAERIAEKLTDMMRDEELREATEKDMDLLLEWANENGVRAASFCSRPITREEHEKWFEKVLNSNHTFQFIYEKKGLPVGQIRLETEQQSAIISYSIAKEYRGKGYGKRMVEMLEREVHRNHPDIVELQAFVKENNIASQKVFEGLRFKKCGDRYSKAIGFRRAR